MDSVSHLPRPKGLLEMASSATNSRDGSRKHYLSNLPEPSAKRKTLIERAGEPLKTMPPAPPSSKPVHPSVTKRFASNTSSYSTLHMPSFSQSYRNTSNTSACTIGSSTASSFSSSVSGGNLNTAHTIQQSTRPKTAMSGRGPKTRAAIARPATAMATQAGTQDNTRKLPLISPPKRPGARMIQPIPGAFRDRHDIRNMPPPFRLPMRKLPPRPACITAKPIRSLSTCVQDLSLDSMGRAFSESARPFIVSQSKLPRPATPVSYPLLDHIDVEVATARTPKPSKPSGPVTPIPIVMKSPFPPFSALRPLSVKKSKQFLTKWSDLEAWNFEENDQNVEQMYEHIRMIANTTLAESSGMKETLSSHAATISALQMDNKDLRETNTVLRVEKEKLTNKVTQRDASIEDLKERNKQSIQDLERRLSLQHEREIERTTATYESQITALERRRQDDLENAVRQHDDAIKCLRQHYEDSIDSERSARIELSNQSSTQGELLKQQMQAVIDRKDQEINSLSSQIQNKTTSLLQEQRSKSEIQESLQKGLSTASATITHLEVLNASLQAKIQYLESDSKSQSESYAAMEKDREDALNRANEADLKLRKAETQRRLLHDTIQNLKGNIQVVCRQRPALGSDGTDAELATVNFPDEEEMKQIEVRGLEERSSIGTVTTKKYPFTFDKAFTPTSSNGDVFQEIEPLIQSAIDGYNVCIFAYGQTGSGKTHTMSSQDGVMPRAIQKIYDNTKNLEETGWSYKIQGSFVEVYNENINDLLADADQMDKKKHEIKHDMAKCETTITDVTVVNLDSQDTVANIVDQAMSRRSVAATKLNERSSRSHSVFILKLAGHNSITGETSKGTLNMVDLAGSERVSRSKVEGDRLKETQSINKSLACLGDVIGALGSKEAGVHVPYRNTKLTYLLQFSLGGNSKTLMFVMVSPLKEHLGETLTSLKFATKVHGTQIGTAKRAK